MANCGGRCGSLWSIKAPSTGVKLVESQGSIDSPPKVVVFDRYHFAMAFPFPAVGSPLVEASIEDAVDVGAGGDEREARRAWDCFQAANYRQQL